MADGFIERIIEVDDGVRLATFERPGASAGAPTLFLANGLGGNLITWRHQLRRLGPHYRVVSWDYRGLYRSALTAAQRRTVALDIPRHARDAVAVLDAYEVERAVFVGWSMGVQLNFELAQRVPARIEGLIQIAGSFGRSLSTTRFGKFGERFAIPVMDLMKHAMVRGGADLVDKGIDSGLLLSAAKRLGIVAPSIDPELTAEIVRAYVRLDFDVYNRILATLGDHDAEAQLSGLAIPTLVLAGDRDPMTPAWLSRRMAEALPDAELVIVAGGSHYVPVEFPEQVNAALTSWLQRRLGHAIP